MVIGLKDNMSEEKDLQSKKRMYDLAQDFSLLVTNKHDFINCQKLIGPDRDNPEDYTRTKVEGMFDDYAGIS